MKRTLIAAILLVLSTLLVATSWAAATQTGAISGHVYEQDGITPIEGAELHAREPDWGEWFRATTDAGGAYTINGLSASEYIVMVHAPPQGFAYEYYENTYDRHAATRVTVTAGQTTGGIDLTLAPGGTISGHVVDATDSTPIENIEIHVIDTAGQGIYAWGHSTADGSYTVVGVPFADYKIDARGYEQFGTGGYAQEYWQEKTSWAAADIVAVSAADADIADIDFTLDPAGSISGRVFKADGSTVITDALISVHAHGVSVGSSSLGTYVSQTDGSYTISGLAPGTYKVEANNNHEPGYVSKYYDDKTFWDVADTVEVLADQTTTGIDFGLESAGSVSGHVYESDGVTPIEGADVWAAGPDDHYIYHTNSQADGNYTIGGLGSDTYKVKAFANDHLWEWYQEKDSHWSADTIAVIAPGNTPGIDFTLDPAGSGSISGRVMEADGTTPIPNAWVHAMHTDFSDAGVEGAYSLPDGTYQITGLFSDTYIIAVDAPGYGGVYYDDAYDDPSATPVVVVEPNDTPGIDFQLSPEATVSGHVYEVDGFTAIAGAEVRVWPKNGGQIRSATSSGDGSYTVGRLSTGEYVAKVSANGYAVEYYQDAQAWSSATPISVTQPNDTAGIDFTLDPAGSISGHVYEEGGVTPIANARVEIDIYSQNESVAGTQTDAQGYYHVDGLSPRDDYRVEVSANGYLRAFYPQQARWVDAVEVSVLAGQTTSDIDVHLPKADSYITGRVTYEGGSAAANVWMEAFHNDGWFVGINADENGEYISPVISGTWWVFPYDPPNVTDGKSVSVNSGETVSDIDFVLQPGGTVAGTVVAESDGTPLAHITVGVERTSDNRWWYDCTDDNGQYQVQGITYGDYKVWTRGDSRCGGNQDYVREYWQEKRNWDDADVVTLSAGNLEITGTDFTLRLGGSISGQVLKADGVTPVEGACVNVSSTAPEWKQIAGYCCTDSEGDFAIRAVPTGKVHVRTHADCQGMHPDLQDEWYAVGNSTPDASLADTVLVRAGQDTGGLSLTLDVISSGAVKPDVGGTVTSTADVTTTVTFPPNAVSEPVTVTIKITTSRPISTGFSFLGQGFTIEATTADGTPVTTFSEPFTITIHYDDADVQGVDESTLAMYYWDASTEAWIELPTTVDADANTITVVLDHLTEFAVLAENKSSLYLPLVTCKY